MLCEINFDGGIKISKLSTDFTIRIAEFSVVLTRIAFCTLAPEYDAEALFRSALCVLPLMLRDTPYTRGLPRKAWAPFARHAIRTGGKISPPPEFDNSSSSDDTQVVYRRFLWRAASRAYAHDLKRSHENFIGGLRNFQLKLESFCRRAEDPDNLPHQRDIKVLSKNLHASYCLDEDFHRLYSDSDNLHVELLDLGNYLSFDFPFEAIHPSDLISRLSVYLLNALGPDGFQDFWRVAGYSNLCPWHDDIEPFQGSFIQKELAGL
ncbi:TPA_asm: P0 protein [Paspalum notatum polerovirus]|uniref:P0 protein n=1 Tax=Paspalum notatum polerovirus TaxID=2885087 RepID=A0AAD2QFX1_9VIRU|nr:TPA_asm: P0 protein [Paspalum notatum polerovirus]